MKVNTPGEGEQQLSAITNRIVDGLNYLMGEEAGMREDKARGTYVYIHDTPVVIPNVVAAAGIALDAGFGSYTFCDKLYIEGEFAKLEDRDKHEVIPLPLQEGTLQVDPARVEGWDELKKQRVLNMTNHLLGLCFSVKNPNV
jgi:hypothetical protein